MKRLLAALFLALLASLALAVNPANTTHSNGQGPQMDLAAGTGQLDAAGLALKEAHVNAMSSPSGGNPQGHFYLEAANPSFGDLDVRGRVTCLQVIGNRATVGGVIERSKDPSFPTGTGILLWVRDDDEGVGDGVDYTLVDSPLQECQGFNEPIEPINQGNFLVHDAP
jgi:hypothetical protein